jgi:two-component system, cell cycle response regulator
LSENVLEARQRLVLAVDDDEHTRNLLRDLCEASGFKVVTAVDGNDALDRIKGDNPDLVLLDLMMPIKDGYAVLRVVRETQGLKDLPIIILTANGDMDGKIKGMELGADDYVTKPFQTRINSALTVREYRRRLQAAEEELSQLRAVDPVTGAGTYSQLKASLDSEIARSRRYGRPVSALLLGFDDYQGLRYQLGRDKCDGWMARMATELKGALRGADRMFRMDADEFVMLLPETDLKGARIVADRVAELIRGVPAEGRAGPFVPKFRVGGSVFPDDRVRAAEDLLREANRSYRALRESATNKVVFDA